jgi:hypothetical protein
VKFTPKTTAELEAEAALRGPFPNGEYDFDFVDSEDAVSKNGNDMIAVTLKVYNSNGDSRKVKDWLLESMAYKLKHACETCGLGDAYEAGSIEAFDLLNRSGRVKLKIEKSSGYPDKNAVVDYVVDDSAKSSPRAAVRQSEPESDLIPF